MKGGARRRLNLSVCGHLADVCYEEELIIIHDEGGQVWGFCV